MSYRTLAEAVEDLARRGFSDVLRVVDGRLRANGQGEALRTEELTIHEFYRFEGISDPDDMEIVYAIGSARGVRGTLVDAFGVYSDPAKSAVLEGVPFRAEGRLAP